MKKLTTTLLCIVMLFTISCQDQKEIKPPPQAKVTIKPLTDERIKAEILSMVEGSSNSSGRTTLAAPLPSGYDYDNMTQVYIEGTNWTTYVAYSTTVNTEDHKEMVGLYYDEYGNYKNYMYATWKYADIPDKERYYDKYTFPMSYPDYYTNVTLWVQTETAQTSRVRPPSECGQYVSDCMSHFYSNQGWLSVGLTFVSLYQPEVFVGVIGGCMLSCALL
jgi:hypothetical protein